MSWFTQLGLALTRRKLLKQERRLLLQYAKYRAKADHRRQKLTISNGTEWDYSNIVDDEAKAAVAEADLRLLYKRHPQLSPLEAE